MPRARHSNGLKDFLSTLIGYCEGSMRGTIRAYTSVAVAAPVNGFEVSNNAYYTSYENGFVLFTRSRRPL